MNDVTMTESRVAERLGVDRVRVRSLRAGLEEGIHWMRVRQAVVYTEAGLEKIAGMAAGTLVADPAGAPGGQILTPREDRGQAWMFPPESIWRALTPDPVVVVRVVRQCRNVRVLDAEREDGVRVQVLVKPSPLWRPGMHLPCTQVGETTFEYRGRLPRSWGRWV